MKYKILNIIFIGNYIINNNITLCIYTIKNKLPLESIRYDNSSHNLEILAGTVPFGVLRSEKIPHRIEMR